MEMSSRDTKIIAESNDSLQVILSERKNSSSLNQIDTSKIFIKTFPNGNRHDSTISKDLNGNWVKPWVSMVEFDTDSNMIQTNKYYRNGVWENGILLMDSKTDWHYYCLWDSTLQSWTEEWLQLKNDHNDTYYFAIIKRSNGGSMDTIYQTQENFIYDLNGNKVSWVYLSKDSTNPWIKIDSSVYTYAQINVNASNHFSQKKPSPLSFSFTSQILRVATPGITGIRIYDVTGRLVFSVSQPAASAISLDLRKGGCTRLISGKYLIQIDSDRRVQTIPLLLMY
jgi:hypothetical protein